MRIEDFIREGVEQAKSPWVRIGRTVFIKSVFWILFSVGMIWYTIGRLGAELTPELRELVIGPALWIAFIPLILLLAGPGMLRALLSEETRARLAAWKRWHGDDSATKRVTADYMAAAQALRSLKPTSYRNMVEFYGQDSVDLLLLADAITFHDGKVRRMVSVRAIEEDRAANAEDDKIEGE